MPPNFRKGRKPARWGPATRRNATVAVKRAFRSAKKAGHIPANPVDDLHAPTAERREATPTAEQVVAVREAIQHEPCFADVLAAIYGTVRGPARSTD